MNEYAQLLLQLGVSGAVLGVGYLIAMALIRVWRDAEAARTKAIVDGFTGLVGKVDTHHLADIESHRELGEGLVEIRTKLDEARWYREKYTPVHGVPITPSSRTATPAQGTRMPRPGTHHDKGG